MLIYNFRLMIKKFRTKDFIESEHEQARLARFAVVASRHRLRQGSRQPSSHSLQGTWEYNKQKHDDVLDDLHGAYAGILLAAFEVRPCRVAHSETAPGVRRITPWYKQRQLRREERCSVDRLWLEI